MVSQVNIESKNKRAKILRNTNTAEEEHNARNLIPWLLQVVFKFWTHLFFYIMEVI